MFEAITIKQLDSSYNNKLIEVKGLITNINEQTFALREAQSLTNSELPMQCICCYNYSKNLSKSYAKVVVYILVPFSPLLLSVGK